LHTLDCYICNKRSWNLTALRKLQSYIGLTMDLLVRLWHHASKSDATGGEGGCVAISTGQGNRIRNRASADRTYELTGSARVRVIPPLEIPLLTYLTIGARFRLRSIGNVIPQLLPFKLGFVWRLEPIKQLCAE